MLLTADEKYILNNISYDLNKLCKLSPRYLLDLGNQLDIYSALLPAVEILVNASLRVDKKE